MTFLSLSWRKRTKALMHSVARFAFPPVCVGCGKPDDLICQRCQDDILWLNKATCPRCLQPIEDFDKRCCLDSQPSAVFTAVSYIGPIPKAIHHLKYEGHFALAQPLAQLMANAWQPNWPIPQLVVPIPLHKTREKKRSYNQSALLANELSALWDIPADATALHRVRATTPQVGLNANERQNNVINAFWANSLVKGKTILLVDDVYTTGATMQAAAIALHKAGAENIMGFTLAKAEIML